jgi:SAM-dependent methyltransferase
MTGSGQRDDAGLVVAGYDLVHAAFARSPSLQRMWRVIAAGADYPEPFVHFSFLTLAEARRLAAEVRVRPGDLLIDLGCGTGGPGLWTCDATETRLRGIDVSAAAVALATERAAALGLPDRAGFAVGTFADTGLDDAVADAVMSVDALQYAPDKRAAFAEVSRILRPGGRLVFTNFELEPDRVAGLPVYGMDPVADYRPLLEAAGFDVDAYEETPGWDERLTAGYEAILASADVLRKEMGDAAYELMASDMSFTVEHKPYRRRVFAVASRTPDGGDA